MRDTHTHTHKFRKTISGRQESKSKLISLVCVKPHPSLGLWKVTIISPFSSDHENPLIHYGSYQLEWRQNKEAGETLAVLPRRGNGADNATVARQGLCKWTWQQFHVSDILIMLSNSLMLQNREFTVIPPYFDMIDLYSTLKQGH